MRERQIKQDGIIIGNQVDKANVSNPLFRKLVENFDRCLFSALDECEPLSIHEVGCGEGRLTEAIANRYEVDVLASDFSKLLIEGNMSKKSRAVYISKSIYDLNKKDRRHTIVCCEVLEHLERPEAGVRALASLKADFYILSVPSEPIWRVLNMFRGKYISDWGNTPGHLNHWSKSSFEKLLESEGFVITEWLNPFPWLMVRARIAKD